MPYKLSRMSPFLPFLPFLLGNLWRTAALTLLLCLGIQALRIHWLQDARDIAIANAAVAVSVNEAQEGMIAALVADRDALLLARAQEAAARDAAVKEAQALAAERAKELSAANAKIKELAKRPACQAVMSAAICPEIERELKQ